MAESLPTGTVTFLFTDIEGSTRISQEHRGSWEPARQRHGEILRRAIESNNGHVFQIIGDAFCAAFDSPGEAVRAALKAQRDLQAGPWPDVPIRVRMGIHTGVAEPDQQDYRGYLTLSSVQRIMSAGHGGQVLLSQAAVELLEGDLPEDVSLRDMGEHRLKDLLKPHHLHQMVAADIPCEFPPLRTLEQRPHNLPIQLTSFVGRQAEMCALGDLIRKSRLVTLTGVGGTGKTRLALQVAADILHEFPDGAWLTELAPLSDPELVPQAIATALNVREQPGRQFIDVLRDHLCKKHLLVLLDNCEHLVDSCAQATDTLLHAAPELTMLATSREALGIAGEAAFPVRSLPLPAASAATAADVSHSDAVRLFADRAASVQPGFQVTDQNARAVAQICARLDGIPLAIELAAARVGALGVGQIAAHLDDRFRLLTGGSRTALPRQRTLQAAIDWSYNLLAEAERTMLRRLSVFAGGWTLEAAEAVCCQEAIKSTEVLDLLSRLVGKSLVVADEQRGVVRYRVLETIRQYAQEKLVESGEADTIRLRHLDYFATLAQQFEREWLKGDSVAWMQRMRCERDNYRNALDWSLGAGKAQSAMQVVSHFGEFWRHFLPMSEGREFVERILAAAPEPTIERGEVLEQLGVIAVSQGDDETALAMLQELVSLADSLGDVSLMIRAKLDLGWKHLVEADEERAFDLLQQALNLSREAGRPELEGEVLLVMGEVARSRRDHAQAREFDERAMALLRQSNHLLHLSSVLGNLACGLIHFNELERSKALLTENWSMDMDIGSVNYPFVILVFGYLANAKGQAVKAVRLAGAASALLAAEGRVLDTGDHPDYEDNLASLHAQLDETTFKNAWDEGALMTTEQAIEYAMDDNRD